MTSLVSKNLKVLYRNAALGLLWSLQNPLVMIVTLSVVWKYMFNADENFTAMVLVALVPYNFVVYCLTGCDDRGFGPGTRREGNRRAARVHGRTRVGSRGRSPGCNWCQTCTNANRR